MRGMRLEKLCRELDERALGALLVIHPENRRYLSGFTGSVGVLLISKERALLATDFRYVEQATGEAPRFEIRRIGPRFVELLPELAAEVGVKRIGFEGDVVTFAQHDSWHKAADECFELVPAEGLVEGIRAVKEEEELDIIRQAAALSDAAFDHILSFVQPGMREREIAWELEAFMRTHGAEAAAFPIIVASGPNSAMPHARSWDRRVQPGEPILMDLGAKLEGYCSDLTRTIVLGAPDERFREVYPVVLEAQQAALRGVRAGMRAEEADAVARRVIEEAGYGEAFGHSLGHGVGLAVHERPRAGKDSSDVLEPGMTLTIEPGIYLPGWGGVRIEDLVVIREGGVENLTRAIKEPQVNFAEG